MAYYQLYHYAAGRRFDHADRFQAADDDAALDKTSAKACGHDMELWCGPRRVRIFELSEGESAN